MENLDYDQALNYAFRLLGFRMRTIKEIAERLAKKGCSQATLNLVVERLQELGYLNDNNYVESYVRSKIKPTGRRRLQYELLTKGVDKETVESGLHKNYSPEQELASAQSLAEKLLRQEQKKQQNKELNLQEKLIKQETIQKIAQKMLNRGFSYSIVSQVMRKIAQYTVEYE